MQHLDILDPNLTKHKYIKYKRDTINIFKVIICLRHTHSNEGKGAFCRARSAFCSISKKKVLQRMQKLLFAELSSKIQRAHFLGLISYDTPEIEFNLNEHFIAESIEYWPTWERLPSQHVLVQIPPDLRAQFRFDSVAMNVRQ